MQARIQKIDFLPDRRIICVSDIHTELALFKRLLAKINYSEDDYLFIVGDFLERGSGSSLETLHYFMDLSKKKNVHVVLGNSDDVWYMMSRTIRPDLYIEYLLDDRNSLVKELCRKINLQVNFDSDCYKIAEILKEHFPKEWEFLTNLPHIIESEDYLFVHGGINPNKEGFCDDPYQLMKCDNFEGRGFYFDKYVIVGHWPVSNYAKEIISFNPRINEKQRIISIDGGNVLKSSGQLNALIIENGRFSSAYVDNLPQIIVTEAYLSKDSYSPISVSWRDSQVEVLEHLGEFSNVRHLTSGHEFKVLARNLYQENGKTYCSDATTNHLKAYEGEKLGLVYHGSRYSLAKKEGILGWIKNSCFKLE